MTLLPGTNYMSNSARTDAEMQVALDKVNEVIAEIGSKDVTTLTIGSGTLTTPLSSMVSIASEGGAGVADTLATIGVSNIDKGRMVILQHANSAETESTGITITHGAGAGAIEMKDSMSFILCSKRMLGLIYTGATGRWQEVWRGYGRSTAEEKLAERTDMGLGTASVEHIATSAAASQGLVLKVKTGTNLGTGEVLAVDTDGRIVGATISTNANTLDNLDSTEFVRKTGTAAQSIDADLTVATTNASLIADGSTTAALRLKGGVAGSSVERAFVELVESNGEMTIGTKAAGGAATVGMKFDPAAGNAGSGGRIVSGVGDIVADIIEANLVSAGDASAGSFRVAAGAYNLLVQWGGDFVDSGTPSSGSGISTLTFAEAYTSIPWIIGGGYVQLQISSTITGHYVEQSYTQPHTVTTTYIQYPLGPYTYNSSYFDRFWQRSGNYIAIGIVA